ncbi:extracellular solute-binding protein [Micromonospora sp. STR1s_5]|nr:extracellular solute-binding protein [Micromonospora sp. STR1s_5]
MRWWKGLPELAGAVAVGIALLQPVAAEETTLTVISHKVHENVARGLVPGTTGGDIAGEWAKRKGVKLNWITANIEPMHDRLFRELSLRETSIDLAFVINKFSTPKISRLLEPLDDWQKKAPIEAFDKIPSNLLVAVKYNGQLTAVPFRHATTGLFYNTALLKERGLDGLRKRRRRCSTTLGSCPFRAQTGRG